MRSFTEEHAETAGQVTGPQPTSRDRVKESLLTYGILMALVLLLAVASVVHPAFWQPQNLLNILSQNAPVAIVAIGMTFVIIAGGFDLSVGAIYALSATVYASMALQGGLLTAALATLFVGLLAGTFNGILVSSLNINAFVATLASSSIFSGVALLYSRGAPFVVYEPNFKVLGGGRWGLVPISIIIAVALFGCASLVLRKTVYGQSIYAIGGNDEASRLSGLRVDLVRGSSFALAGLLSALAGMMVASRLGVGQADIGSLLALDAIAIVVVGGTSLRGGEGAIWRTAVGVLILAVLNNLFFSLAIESAWQMVAKGSIIAGAVALDVYVRKRSS